jgi:CubicO group peptidase (beta-lactamase class C family)
MPRPVRRRRLAPEGVCLRLLLLSACAPGGTPNEIALEDPIWGAVDLLSQQFRQERELPGLSVAVMRGPDVVFARGYGWANTERGAPVTPETLFPIGSIEKEFTAAAVLRLADEGRIRLDGAITKYLPSLCTGGHEITLRDMLHQVSGLREGNNLARQSYARTSARRRRRCP